jgi:DNA integrity scanning protein DisA with diadenylate cyclase activity
VFDQVLGQRGVERISRAVLSEIAGLDGAVVIDGSGKIRAYGAVLSTKKSTAATAAEGARTKAAISAPTTAWL